MLKPHTAAVQAGTEITDELLKHGWSERKLAAGIKPGLAKKAGSGIRLLLNSDEDMEEAVHTCNVGLLSAQVVSEQALRNHGKSLIADAIEPLEKEAEPSPS